MAKLKKKTYTMADVEAGRVTEDGKVLKPEEPTTTIAPKEPVSEVEVDSGEPAKE